MKTNAVDRRGEIPLMQQTRTWILLYAFGIAVLVLSLCRPEDGKPAGTPSLHGTVVQSAAPGISSDVMRP